MTEPKTRSRTLILWYITQFSLLTRYGEHVSRGLSDSAFHAEGDAIPGDLVALQSAPPSKWYLSWLVSKQWPEGWACEQYTLESIEDGELCDWSNVGLIYYNRKKIQEHPEWRWTDAQHEFNDIWKRVCSDERDAYTYLPTMAEFHEGGGVTLGTRTRYNWDERRPRKTFSDWRAVTKEKMLEFYDAAVAEVSTKRNDT